VTSPDRPTEEPSPSPSQPTSEPPSRATAGSPGPGQKVISAASDFGTVLFDDTGQAIYLFDIETTSRPRCYGPCARAWPPVLTDGPPLAGRQVNAALLGTTPRTDGTTQVTYDGHPLYFYAHEGKYDVECHDIFLNGGNWYAVQPNGRRAP
jgi:predicted lipoprotein with Yx(FWY)xxD motif